MEKHAVRGFYHVQLVNPQTGEILGDAAGENVITDSGRKLFQVYTSGGLAGLLVISHLGLATKTTNVASADNTIAGEVGGRKSLNDTTNVASNRKLWVTPATLQMVASWAGSDIAGTSNIASIFCANSSNAGTVASAATYTASAWTSDQNVNVTYEWRFA